MTHQARPADERAANSRLLAPGWWAPAELPDERTPGSAPGWSAVVERAVATAASPAAALPAAATWREAFAVPLRPFLTEARDRLISAAEQHLPPGAADPAAVAGAFTGVLAGALAELAVRTLMAELASARTGGHLPGADGRERFAAFLDRQSTPSGLAALFGRYPVLGRLLGNAVQSAGDAAEELLARFAADRSAVLETLAGPGDPGPVVAITPGLGDAHRHGRTVSLVRFASGRTVVYKPRSLETQARYAEVVHWLNARIPWCGLRAARVLTRPGYGWMEFIATEPLPRPGDARQFYRREGVLLAALYALHASDIHCENIVAAGAQPVVIDAETLFHPVLPAPDALTPDPAARALGVSVHRTALLPYVTVGEHGILDCSGMGGDPGELAPEGELDWEPPATDETRLVLRPAPYSGARNRPYSGERLFEPADHEADVLDGFRLGYYAIVRDRSAFTQFMTACADMETRVVLRPSRGYAQLLADSADPGLLHRAVDRDQALGALERSSAGHPLWQQAVPGERAALWAGDLPLITSRPATRDLWTCAGHRLPGVLEHSALDSALAKLAGLGDIDLSGQEWIISASLASRRAPGGHRDAPPAATGDIPATAEPDRLLATACGLADQIVARGATLPGDDEAGRINWLGLQLVDDARWMVLPMGAGLADGYLGVALFLAQLSRLTGIARYAQIARRALIPVPQLWAALGDRPDLLAAVGIGSSEGLGGMSYGLARVARLLDDDEVRDWARTGVRLTAAAAQGPATPGWADGTAGCLAAMAAVHAEIGSGPAWDLAAACASQLAAVVSRTDGWCEPDGDQPQTGFTAGPAGPGWALARFAGQSADPRYSEPALRALRRAGEQAAHDVTSQRYGWCEGLAGLLVARSGLVPDAEPSSRKEALHTLTERPVLSDLSLCHGELGITDALIVLAGQDRSPEVLHARRRRAGLVLSTLHRPGRYCAPPGRVATPGLRHGLAGIGYGLLRLGFPEQVPSVLLLETGPARSVHQPDVR